MPSERSVTRRGPSEGEIPIVVFDRSDGAWVFPNHVDASEWMEAADVVDGEYHAYDVDGYVLSLSTRGDRVVIRRTSERAYEEALDQLRRVMSDGSVSVSGRTLEEILQDMLDQESRLGLRRRLSLALRRLLPSQRD